MPKYKIRDNSKIIIIGGGPAGCLFALHTLKLIEKYGIFINLKIIEKKDFTKEGPKGCNMCAGVIGGRVIENIKALGIEFSSKVFQQEIEGFKIYLENLSAEIKKREKDKVYTVFRGNGPLGGGKNNDILGFDGFILKKTIEKGVNLQKGEVSKVYEKKDKIFVSYKDERGEEFEEGCDLVVVACGINTTLIDSFNFGYVPPPYWHTCQTEVEMEEPKESQKFINIFSRKNSSFLFTALTPKGKYVTITGIGKWVKFQDLLKEIETLSIKKILGEVKFLCHCHPRVPIKEAKNPYHNRIVFIGDAFVSRYLKNGIESAYFTSQWAAETAIEKGIDRDSFEENYGKRCLKFFSSDNKYGKAMFLLHKIVTSSKLISLSCMQILWKEGKDKENPYWLSDILWHLFAGDKAYKKIFKKTFKFSKFLLVFLNFFKNIWKMI